MPQREFSPYRISRATHNHWAFLFSAMSAMFTWTDGDQTWLFPQILQSVLDSFRIPSDSNIPCDMQNMPIFVDQTIPYIYIPSNFMPSNSHQPHLESSRIGPGYPCGGNGGRLAPCEPGVDTVVPNPVLRWFINHGNYIYMEMYGHLSTEHGNVQGDLALEHGDWRVKNKNRWPIFCHSNARRLHIPVKAKHELLLSGIVRG
jgi:hypothetical protein